MSINLTRMVSGYTECIAWADCNEDCGPEFEGASFSAELLAAAETDCAAFIAQCGETLLDQLAELAPEYSDERFGHDFWLTRGGHGAGFWDRKELETRTEIGDKVGGYTLGERLTSVAQTFPNRDCYVGDDGQIYN